MSTLHILYMVFLIVFAIAVIVVTNVDFADKGECRYSGSPNDPKIQVRQPGSNAFVDRELCVIIYS